MTKSSYRYEVQVDKTQWTLTQINQLTSPSSTMIYKLQSIFSLSDFDPASVKSENSQTDLAELPRIGGVEQIYTVTASTTNKKQVVADKEVITFRYKNQEPTVEEHNRYTHSFNVAFQDKALAERVAKAFAHAIVLSGGKVTKEIF